MTLLGSIDRPEDYGMVQRHGFAIEGWLLAPEGQSVEEIVVDALDIRLGSTRHTYPRPDVSLALALDPQVQTGFTVDCIVPEGLRGGAGIDAVVRVQLTDGSLVPLGTRRLKLSGFDYRVSGHGYMFTDGFERVMKREEIYASGPPSPVADDRCVDLIARYLKPGSRVIDVGCGIGAYGHALQERGFRWTGCEVREDFVARACSDGLDVRLVTDGRLPFEDQSFDAAIAVEVLEHVTDFEPFADELRRVAPLALISVPNFETIPVTASFYALPWHMLEPDHHNFFSHTSLSATLARRYRHVEVIEYGPLPLLRSQDGLALNNHLFAIAST